MTAESKKKIENAKYNIEKEHNMSNDMAPYMITCYHIEMITCCYHIEMKLKKKNWYGLVGTNMMFIQ